MSGLSLNVKCQEQKYRAVEIDFASIPTGKKSPLTMDSPGSFSTDDNDKKVQCRQYFLFLLAMSTLTRE